MLLTGGPDRPTLRDPSRRGAPAASAGDLARRERVDLSVAGDEDPSLRHDRRLVPLDAGHRVPGAAAVEDHLTGLAVEPAQATVPAGSDAPDDRLRAAVRRRHDEIGRAHV